jgi:outer membrane protein assembly factor BamD
VSSLRGNMRTPYPALAAALLALAAGCASLANIEPGDPNYAADAEANLRLGNTALQERDFERARKFYEHVRSRFPYAEEASEAEVRLADSDFDQQLYAEAREKYGTFVKLHPTSPLVDYAAYRYALTHVEEIPSDVFFLPPVAEKDQAASQAALRTLNDFLRQYPSSPRVKEAQVALDRARKRLAEHEMYVASFYQRRERWKAVAQRLEILLERYPGTPLEEKALFSLHEAYVKLQDAERAREVLQRVISRLPGTPAAERAQRMLGS